MYNIATATGSWATGGNWSGAAAPVSGDTVFFNHLGTGDITSGLATGVGSGAGAESLNLIFENTWGQKLGAVASGAATYLTFSSTLETLNVSIGQQSGQSSGTGSTRIFLDSTNVTTATLTLYDSASTGAETYYPPILIKGTWTIYQYGGSLGVAARPGETATITAATIAPPEGDWKPNVAPQLFIGAGVTLTRLDARTGTVLNRSSNTNATVNLSGDAQYTYEGSGSHTTTSIDDDAIIIDKGTGTAWTTLNNNGKYLRRGITACTIGGTLLNLYPGCTYDVKNGKAGTTTTSNETLIRCGMGDVKIITNPGEFI